MKKAIILVLLMVMVLSSAALAAEVKVGGEARYILTFPKDECGAPDWSDTAQYRIKVSANLNETTTALIYFRNKPTEDAAHFNAVYNAQLTTKLAGIGSLTLGQDYNDYGSAPFAWFGTVWGNTGDEKTGILFATEDFGGFSGQFFLTPMKKTWDHENDKWLGTFMAGELNYALPVLEGTTIGAAFYKGYDQNAAIAATANLALGQVFSVYGELGKTDTDLDELNVKTVGAKAVLNKLTLYAETDVEKKQNYLQATLPFQGVSLNASYQFGEGYEKYWDCEEDEWVNAGEDGKVTVWAKVSF